MTDGTAHLRYGSLLLSDGKLSLADDCCCEFLSGCCEDVPDAPCTWRLDWNGRDLNDGEYDLESIAPVGDDFCSWEHVGLENPILPGSVTFNLGFRLCGAGPAYEFVLKAEVFCVTAASFPNLTTTVRVYKTTCSVIGGAGWSYWLSAFGIMTVTFDSWIGAPCLDASPFASTVDLWPV